ncbi:MAG: hypothetical protein ACYDH8_14095 [Syntrophales bacterium]
MQKQFVSIMEYEIIEPLHSPDGKKRGGADAVSLGGPLVMQAVGELGGNVANTTTQNKIRKWIINEWTPKNLGLDLTTRDVGLSTGGTIRLKTVSTDGKTIVTITTSRAETPSGTEGRGKLSKVRADLYFVLLAQAVKRSVLLCTEQSMLNLLKREIDEGRILRNTEIHLVTLPEDLREQLNEAQTRASVEVSPR